MSGLPSKRFIFVTSCSLSFFNRGVSYIVMVWVLSLRELLVFLLFISVYVLVQLVMCLDFLFVVLYDVQLIQNSCGIPPVVGCIPLGLTLITFSRFMLVRLDVHYLSIIALTRSHTYF